MAFPAPSTRAGRFLSEGLSLDLTQTRGRHRVGGGPQASRETQGQPGPSLSRGSCPGRQRPEVAREAESSCKLSPTRHPACTGRGLGQGLCRGRGICICPSLPGLSRGQKTVGPGTEAWGLACALPGVASPPKQVSACELSPVPSGSGPGPSCRTGGGGGWKRSRRQNLGHPPNNGSGCRGPRAPPPFSGAPPEHSPRWPQPLSHKASLHRRTSTPRIHLLTVCPPSSSCSGPGRLSGREPQAGSRQTARQ